MPWSPETQPYEDDDAVKQVHGEDSRANRIAWQQYLLAVKQEDADRYKTTPLRSTQRNIENVQLNPNTGYLQSPDDAAANNPISVV